MKSAILVIDVQIGIFDSDTELFESDIVIEKINYLTNEARSRSDSVIFIQHEIPGIVEYESKNWQLSSMLTVIPSDIRIRKTAPDSF